MKNRFEEARALRLARVLAPIVLLAVTRFSATVLAEQPPPPCHTNPAAARDMQSVATRGDVRKLPAPLKSTLLRLAGRPHSILPLQVYAEAEQTESAVSVLPARHERLRADS